MASDKTMQEMKILLVDNEPDLTYAIGTVLRDNGFEVEISARNNLGEGGREFLSLFYAMAMFFLVNQRNSCNLITSLEPSRHMRPLTS
jgi:hypothetical protein